MKVLILSFYFEPDLCAGSFRTTALVEKLSQQPDVEIEVITTLPNRYASFSAEAPAYEQRENTSIHRIKLPSHQSGMVDQAKAFSNYYQQAMNIAKSQSYDMVYATSSRLFTAYLGARIAKQKKLPLYLDIRDVFVDTIKDVLSPKITWAAKPVFSMIERYAFGSAKRINLVSEGFKEYFQSRYSKPDYRWFTNGIDDEFLAEPVTETPVKKQVAINVLYAGNMGEGQGLHSIVPGLASAMGDQMKFTVIGDGGRKAQLEQGVQSLSNVEMLPPVNREKLIRAYQQADVLFLHLNDYPAFKKVLPSKIFEYAALGKPIWAGVSGFAAEFLKREVDNCAIFYPNDVNDGVESFSHLNIQDQDRKAFKHRFARSTIMENMAKDIVEFASHG